jgi:hypothetical protein
VAFAEAQRLGTRAPLSAFFSYEEPAVTLTPRVWSAAMSIQRTKLETMNWEAFTTSERVEDYERRLCSAGGELLGEKERWQLNRGWVNDTIRVFDMTGMGDNPMAGSGYIEEIGGLLQREVDSGRQLRTVIIDCAGDMCRRYVERNPRGSNSMRELRFLLETIGQRLQRDIAVRYKCTVWLVHLLNGELGNAPPTRLMHHSDSADSKQLPVHMSAIACLGTIDKESGCARINWSKVRYKSGQYIAPSIVRIDDRLARMHDVSMQYVADEVTKKIILRDRPT